MVKKMTHHETLLARKAEIETWFAQRERAPAVRLPDQMDETRWLDDQRIADAEADLQRRKLAAIETALTFAAAGLGGKCAECLKPISEKRLAAMPEAVTCRACAEAEEAGQEPATRTHQAASYESAVRKTQGFHMAAWRVGK